MLLAPRANESSRFGWRRRICPGADLASNSFFVALAKLLRAFDINAKDRVEYDIFNHIEGFNVLSRFPLFKENEVVV